MNMLFAVMLALAATSVDFSAAKPTNFGPRKRLGGTPVNGRGEFVIGTAGIRLTVDPNGRAINCKIVSPLTPSPFGTWFCTVTQRDGRFRPAKDMNGNGVHSVYTTWGSADLNGLTLKYDRRDLYLPITRLPHGARAPEVEVNYIVATDGTIERCKVGVTSGYPKLDALACPATISQPFDVVTDASGVPVGSVRSRVIGFVASR